MKRPIVAPVDVGPLAIVMTSRKGSDASSLRLVQLRKVSANKRYHFSIGVVETRLSIGFLTLQSLIGPSRASLSRS